MANTPFWEGKYDRSVRGGAETLAPVGVGGSNAWFGGATANSNAGGLLATISTQLIASSSMVRLTTFVTGSAFPAPAGLGTFVVMSVNPGNSFVVRNAASFAYTGSYQVGVWWEIVNPRSP